MEKEIIENNDIINKAIFALRNNVISSNLCDNDKNELNMLLKRICVYYNKKLNLLLKKNNKIIDKQVMILECFITDIIVEINDVLKCDNDIHYFVGTINKKLNEKSFNKVIGSKKNNY